jgi:hypothetical protein
MKSLPSFLYLLFYTSQFFREGKLFFLDFFFGRTELEEKLSSKMMYGFESSLWNKKKENEMKTKRKVLSV